MGPQVKIKSMQRVWIIVAVSLLASMPALPAFAANDASIDAPIISCGNGIPGGVYCAPTKKDLKEARNAYARGLKLQGQNRLEEAFAQFDEASRLAPQDLAFLSAEELRSHSWCFSTRNAA